MKKSFEKPGNFLYPVPAVMVSCRDEEGKTNIVTVAWTGTVCSDPPMLSISLRKSRYSHDLIQKTGVFVVNLTTEKLVRAADFCGVRSGRDVDKFQACGLTPGKGQKIDCPTIEEAPVSLECRVKQVLELGSHDLFLAEVVCVQVEDTYLDEKGRFHMEKSGLTAYSHGTYYGLGKALGTFGFSVRKKISGKKKHRDRQKTAGDHAQRTKRNTNGSVKHFTHGQEKQGKRIVSTAERSKARNADKRGGKDRRKGDGRDAE